MVSGLAPQDLKSTAEIASANSASTVRLCKDISIYKNIHAHVCTWIYVNVCAYIHVYIYTHM